MLSSLARPVVTRVVMGVNSTLSSGSPQRTRLVGGAGEPSFGGELLFVERAQLGQRRRLAGGFVVAVPLDAREAEGKPGGIGRALLDLVVLHLDHDLRSDTHGVAVVAQGERPQALGHSRELLIGQALEVLPTSAHRSSSC